MDCERVAGRKARGLQTEEISCKCLLKFCVAMSAEELMLLNCGVGEDS